MKKWLIAALIVVALPGIIAFRSHQIIKGVTAVELIAGCQIEVFDTTTQPFTTLILACPRVDAIRFWPLPIVQPWNEDWFELNPLPENKEAKLEYFKYKESL